MAKDRKSKKTNRPYFPVDQKKFDTLKKLMEDGYEIISEKTGKECKALNISQCTQKVGMTTNQRNYYRIKVLNPLEEKKYLSIEDSKFHQTAQLVVLQEKGRDFINELLKFISDHPLSKEFKVFDLEKPDPKKNDDLSETESDESNPDESSMD